MQEERMEQELELATGEQRQEVIEQPEQEEQQEQEETKAIEMDVDQLKEWLGTDEGRRFMQPQMDKYFNKGLETWKQNNLEKLVDAEVEKRFPSDPDKALILTLQNELKLKESKEACVRTLADAGLSIELADHFASTDLKQSQKLVDLFVADYQKTFKEEFNKILKKIGKTPQSSTYQPKTLSREEFLNLPYDKRVDVYNKDPHTYTRLTKG